MQSADECKNVLATCEATRTKSVQARSPDVHANLLAARNRVGAYTPAGHGLSNLNEQNLARPSYVRPAWATHPTQTLHAKMAWQADRLASLSRSKGE